MRRPPLSWLQGFLLASAILIGGVVIASGVAVGSFFEHHVLRHEEEHAVDVVQNQARRHLAPADFDLPGWSGTRKVFEAFIQELPGIVRVTVYDARGRIVWSDEPGLVGKAFPDDRSLRSALGGKVATILEGSVARAYVPITLPQAAGVVGVMETSRDVTQVVLGIRRTQRLIWGAAGGMGLFLYVALAAIARRAALKEQQATAGIREAHAALLAKTEELQQTNQALRDAQAQLVEKERLAAAGQVVIGLHHEILNPLTGILGAFQVLKQEGIARVERAQALAEAEVEIRKIERLIRRLPGLRRAAGTPYVGETIMLDLKRSCAEEERP